MGCLSFVGCCIEFRFDTVVYCCLWLGAFGLLCWFRIFGCVSVVSVVAWFAEFCLFLVFLVFACCFGLVVVVMVFWCVLGCWWFG